MVAAIKSVLMRPAVHRVAVILDMNSSQPMERLVISLRNQKLVTNKTLELFKVYIIQCNIATRT